MTMDGRVTPMEGSCVAPSLVGLGIALCAALHAGPAVAGDSCVMIQFDVTRRCPADCGAPVRHCPPALGLGSSGRRVLCGSR